MAGRQNFKNVLQIYVFYCLKHNTYIYQRIDEISVTSRLNVSAETFSPDVTDISSMRSYTYVVF